MNTFSVELLLNIIYFSMDRREREEKRVRERKKKRSRESCLLTIRRRRYTWMCIMACVPYKDKYHALAFNLPPKKNKQTKTNQPISSSFVSNAIHLIILLFFFGSQKIMKKLTFLRWDGCVVKWFDVKI